MPDQCNKKVYFLSDLHLGARYFDNPVERERCVCAFLDSIRHDAQQIYLLGDILDYWYEYRYVVPRGFTRFFGKIAELSDSGIKITWLIGNHDIWIFDYLPNELGIEVVDGSIVREIMGKKFFLSHGDGVWKSSRRFRFIRALFRNKVCQWLYSGIHPRWTIPFALSWSKSSRKLSPTDKDKEKLRLAVGFLKDFCENYSAAHPDIAYYLFGHLHIIEKVEITPSAEMWIIGDWITNFSYMTYDGSVMRMQLWHNASK
jgi:UDP-2,3-diacylglucosamine hydrolase